LKLCERFPEEFIIQTPPNIHDMNNHLFGDSSQQRFSYSAIRPCTYSTHLALGFLGWWANWLCGYVVKIVVEKNWKSVKYAEICWKIRPKIVRNRHKIGRATCNARRCTCKMRGATPRRARSASKYST